MHLTTDGICMHLPLWLSKYCSHTRQRRKPHCFQVPKFPKQNVNDACQTKLLKMFVTYVATSLTPRERNQNSKCLDKASKNANKDCKFHLNFKFTSELKESRSACQGIFS